MTLADVFGSSGSSTGYAVAGPYSIGVTVGSTATKAIDCLVDLSGKTLSITFETLRSTTDIAVITNANITKSGTEASFAMPAATTIVERTLRARVVDTSDDSTVREVLVFVTYLPTGD